VMTTTIYSGKYTVLRKNSWRIYMVFDTEKIVKNLNEEIEWLEEQLDMDENDEAYDLDNPEYVYYTLLALYDIRGDP
jgi:hypothetical protein